MSRGDIRLTAGFLDAVSGGPLHPAAERALDVSVDRAWADPAALHGPGRESRLLLESARDAVARTIGALPQEVVFTSSGPTALVTGIDGVLRAAQRSSRPSIVVGAVEQGAALDALDRHAAAGADVRTAPVDATGRVDPDEILAMARASGPAAAVVLQVGNREVGTLQPDLTAILGGIPWVVDADQAVGRVGLPAGWSVLAASARSWGGPPGIGILAVRSGVRWAPPGPTHLAERGWTLDPAAVPLAVAAAAALEAVDAQRAAESQRLARLIDRIRAAAAAIPDVEVLGDPVDRLPHVVTFSCLYAQGELLVRELDRQGISVGSGSACTSDIRRPSHVLTAMGALTHGNIRVSLPIDCPAEDVERLIAALPQAVRTVREEVGAP